MARLKIVKASQTERLEAVGVELVPVVQLEGQKLSGLSYRLDGVMMKGSDLGKGYSPAGLTKKGVTYDKNRDFETVRSRIERETSRAIRTADRDLTADQAPERRGFSGDVRAISPSDGGIDGRDQTDIDRNRQEDQRPGRPIQEPNGRSDPKLDKTGNRTTEALERQIEALGVAGFEVGIREAKTGKMINRFMTKKEVKDNAAWL